MKVEFIFSEFGLRTTANQPGGFTDEFRLDPTYSSVKQFFPESKLTLYTSGTVPCHGPSGNLASSLIASQSSIPFQLSGSILITLSLGIVILYPLLPSIPL